ncbi:MAG: hypothetical protein ABIT38_22875 [Gemmatimonadaceae bacterium]
MPESTPNDLRKPPAELVAEMEKLIGGSPGNPAFNTLIAMKALHKFGCLLTVVSASADKQSRRIVYLTWALLAFTVALFTLTVLLYQDSHTLIHREEAKRPNYTEAPQRDDAKP